MKISEFILSENVQVLEVKFSIYLNMHIFVISQYLSGITFLVIEVSLYSSNLTII